VNRLGARGEKLFGGAIASVTVGLEILRLRKLQQSCADNPAIVQPIADFLKRLARALLLRAHGDSWAPTIARMREQAATIAAKDGGTNALQMAASLRIIAAAIEAYPTFFRRQA
jgi:hypothetical protein